MYEELVKRLRERAAWINFPHHGEEYPIEDAKLIIEAANAIEELERQLAEYKKFDGFLMAHGMFGPVEWTPAEILKEES